LANSSRVTPLARRCEPFHQFLCLTSSKHGGKWYDLPPPFVSKMRFQHIGKCLTRVATRKLFLYIPSSREVFLERQVPKLVDGLQETINPLMPSLH
jgi:hypothetical protein